jgi:succinyl-diaminopimelate desuccinylase
MPELNNYIDTLRNTVVELQKGLTCRPAINPENGGDGEYDKFLFLKEFIKSWGFDSIEEILVPDDRVSSKIRPTLIAKIKGTSDKNLWIISHIDVVPPGELTLWETNPYEAVVKGDKIFGRGTEDNQQSLVSSLIAAKSVIDNKLKPDFNVNLMFVADEEVGSEFGIKWILDNKNIFSKDDIVLTPDVGDPEGTSIEIAEKSILWATFKIIGKQSHGSRPDLGINAARASSHLCVRLDSLSEIFNAKNEVFDLPYSTFEPTKRVGSVTNMNTIPGEEILGFDCRVVPEYDLDEIVSEMEKITAKISKEFKVSIETTFQQKVQSAPPTSKDSPVVKLLKLSIEKITGRKIKFIGIGGGTVAAYFRMKGIEAALWSTVDNTMHSPNEYSSITNTLNDAKVFADLMMSATK